MIVEKDGRARSHRTLTEEEKLIAEALNKLTPAEREALEVMIDEMRQGLVSGAEPTLFDVIGDIEYKHRPVDMETFIKDDYFLGKTCDNLRPVLMDDLNELFNSGYYNEVIFTGSIGWGKTFAASIAVCRILYLLSCMKNPHRTYGIAVDSNISIVCLSVNEQLAIKVAFENIATKVDASNYFMEHFPYERTKTELRFPGHIWVAARATTDTAALGLNTISALMDEGNFLPKTGKNDPRFEAVDRAEIIYNTLKRRLKSRFQDLGRLPGAIFIISSKQTNEDFTAQRIESSLKDPHVFVRDYALWEVMPEGTYEGENFWVIVGNEQTPSKILDPIEIAHFQANKPEGTILVEVPMEFFPEFDADLEGSIRDIAGIATVSVSPYIQRRERIEDAIDHNRYHPFSTMVLDPGKGGHFNWDQMVAPQLERGGPGGTKVERTRPILNPYAPRHIHIDPALRNDSLGICMAHIGAWKEVERKSQDGRTYIEKAPVFVVDFVLRVVPPAGDEIVLGEIRSIVYELTAHGYNITTVTMDQFQSADTLQTLTGKGYTAELLSVDRTPDPYDNLKMALYEGRVSYYRYKPLLKELRELELHFTGQKKRKIDHPLKGCFVGSTRIPLLDGSVPRIEELDGKEVWVYSSTPDGRIVPGRARGRKTKEVQELVDVVLDSGAVVRCTPEHPWMLRNGEYEEAQFLRPGIDRLMPINRIWPVNGGYERLTDSLGNRVLTSHMVASYFGGEIPEGKCVHHKNHIKTDNRPDNLEIACLADHARRHTSIRHRIDQEWRNRLYEGAQKFNLSDEGRRKHSEALKRTISAMTPEERVDRARKSPKFRSDVDLYVLEALKAEGDVLNANAASRAIGCGRNVVMRVLRDGGFTSWDEFVATPPGNNHKVRYVIPVRLEHPVPVYDLEVDLWSNFALSEGVFVHNSKDCADALAGVAFSLLEERESVPLPILKGMAAYGNEDAWMAEQRQARAAGNIKAALNTTSKHADMLPPFLIGSGGGGDDWGGGWDPGSL